MLNVWIIGLEMQKKIMNAYLNAKYMLIAVGSIFLVMSYVIDDLGLKTDFLTNSILFMLLAQVFNNEIFIKKYSRH